MLNKIVIMGRLTRDPDNRQTQSGKDVTSFTLAVDRDFSDPTTGKRPTDFIDCVAWGNTAIFAHKYFSKGSMAVAAGRLQMRPWEDRNGNKRISAEVVVDNLYFGGDKRNSDSGGDRRDTAPDRPSGGYYGGGYSAPARQSGPPQFEEITEDDGDLPF